MIFVVQAKDHDDAHERRVAVLASHRAYQSRAPGELGVSVLMAGPLTTEDGEMMNGSFFLISSANRSKVEQLVAGDPLNTANVWESFTVNRVQVRRNNVGPLGRDT
ncbi:YciI family protein [Pseudaestuariivita atlantica]|uniref:YCII-related domain-containing protein n=1 Tax=Pseudaestuariivita atlantica TaxID=1317121 RepID=A0A0L1JTR8_9RHOB|nr:YciI family protein [Pseudaestuariivita atlantica]KNG95082.1 hypothetical protein ATO11_00015 [Pseudaestuariivita atlantica]